MKKVKQIGELCIKKYSGRELSDHPNGVLLEKENRVYNVWRGDTFLEESLTNEQAIEFCQTEKIAKRYHDYGVSINQAMDILTEKSASATDHLIRNSFYDMKGVMLRACASDAMRWASTIHEAISYVEAGNFSGTHDGARRLLDKIYRKTVK